MKNNRNKPRRIVIAVVAALLAATATGCIIRTARPCRNECWWSHGRQICERRCY